MALGVSTRHLPSSGVCAPCQARAQACDEQPTAGLGLWWPEVETVWISLLRFLFYFLFTLLTSWTHSGVGAGGPGESIVCVRPLCLFCLYAVSNRLITASSYVFIWTLLPAVARPQVREGGAPSLPGLGRARGGAPRSLSPRPDFRSAALPWPLRRRGVDREVLGWPLRVPLHPPCAVSPPGGTSLGPGVTAVICSQVSWPGMTTASAAWG